MAPGTSPRDQLQQRPGREADTFVGVRLGACEERQRVLASVAGLQPGTVPPELPTGSGLEEGRRAAAFPMNIRLDGSGDTMAEDGN